MRQLSVVIGQEEVPVANVRVTCTNTLLACTRSHCHSAPLTSSCPTLRVARSGAGACGQGPEKRRSFASLSRFLETSPTARMCCLPYRSARLRVELEQLNVGKGM